MADALYFSHEVEKNERVALTTRFHDFVNCPTDERAKELQGYLVRYQTTWIKTRHYEAVANETALDKAKRPGK